MRFGTTQIHVDPGPGALVRALSTVSPERPEELDAIVALFSSNTSITPATSTR